MQCTRRADSALRGLPFVIKRWGEHASMVSTIPAFPVHTEGYPFVMEAF
jgi:hypothetical protein